MGWGDYWRRVCAPKLKARKDALGRAMPEKEIASYVETATGKPSGRGLVSLWLLGIREPFISQYMALCQKLGMDPLEVLRDAPKGRVHHQGDSIPPSVESSARQNSRQKKANKRNR